MARYFGACELVLATETLQYSDYAKYDSEMFDPPARLKRSRRGLPPGVPAGLRVGGAFGGVMNPSRSPSLAIAAVPLGATALLLSKVNEIIMVYV